MENSLAVILISVIGVVGILTLINVIIMVPVLMSVSRIPDIINRLATIESRTTQNFISNQLNSMDETFGTDHYPMGPSLQISKDDDGNLTLKTASGEIFTGSTIRDVLQQYSSVSPMKLTPEMLEKLRETLEQLIEDQSDDDEDGPDERWKK